MIYLNEAKAVSAISKIFGEDYMGNNEEVLSKIMTREAEDEERFNNQAHWHDD